MSDTPYLTDEQINWLEKFYQHGPYELRHITSDLRYYKQLADERGKALEWYAGIIEREIYGEGGPVDYDPLDWFRKYHSAKEQNT